MDVSGVMDEIDRIIDGLATISPHQRQQVCEYLRTADTLAFGNAVRQLAERPRREPEWKHDDEWSPRRGT